MIRVLIVDDSATARLVLAQAVEGMPGFKVVGEAVNGLQAVEMARDLTPDLITMDVLMPHMDGLEATTRIMNSSPTAILVVTSLENPPEHSVAFEALAAGALDVIAKGKLGDQVWERDFREKVIELSQAAVAGRGGREPGDPGTVNPDDNSTNGD